MMRDHSRIDEIVAAITRELKGSAAASLALTNLPCLSAHADIGMGPGAFLIKLTASGVGKDELHMLLTQQLYERVNIIPCAMFVTRGDTNSTLLTWCLEAPCSEHQLLRVPLLLLNLLLDAPRPIFPSETTIGGRDAHTTQRAAEQRLHDMPAALYGLIVPCGRRLTSRGEKSFEEDLTDLRAKLEIAEVGDTALTAAMDLTLSGDSKWGFPDQVRTRLIEYTVALESLLLDQETELSYRFALRLSILLGPVGDRVEFFNQARSAYKLRSNAVHAGARSIKVSDAEVEAARRLLRLAILRYVALRHAGLGRKEIVKRLDLALLSPSSGEELAALLPDEDLWPVEAVV